MALVAVAHTVTARELAAAAVEPAVAVAPPCAVDALVAGATAVAPDLGANRPAALDAAVRAAEAGRAGFAVVACVLWVAHAGASVADLV